jgi:hypothetical protein
MAKTIANHITNDFTKSNSPQVASVVAQKVTAQDVSRELLYSAEAQLSDQLT